MSQESGLVKSHPKKNPYINLLLKKYKLLDEVAPNVCKIKAVFIICMVFSFYFISIKNFQLKKLLKNFFDKVRIKKLSKDKKIVLKTKV